MQKMNAGEKFDDSKVNKRGKEGEKMTPGSLVVVIGNVMLEKER
jgi:hypothetical protein